MGGCQKGGGWGVGKIGEGSLEVQISSYIINKSR